ncbi:MAG: excinuclease ABC subunit UvrA [Planctomycetota bacterium]|nr:excinuclease ABC subunit UvrA [Planctomycetota bacterium]
MSTKTISIRGAREHNLKSVDIDIPRDKLVVITGLSGSGKSTLAFDTIYAEGQRKYVESLSAYARQFLEQLQKPAVESIEGLPPTIAIEQRSASHNPRSTVATTTEIYDYLRLLMARVGQPRCWHVDEGGKVCGRPIASQSASKIIETLMAMPEETKLMILAPLVRGKKGHHQEVFDAMVRQGFVRARADGEVMDLRAAAGKQVKTPFQTKVQRYQAHNVEAVVDRVVIKHDPEAGVRTRIADSVELSLKLADGLVIVAVQGEGEKWHDTLYSEKWACTVHPECSLQDLEPRLFSFNSPYGACPSCDGLGTIQEFDPELVVPDGDLPLSEGAIDAWRHHGKRMNIYYSQMLRRFCRDFGVDPLAPYKTINKTVQRVLLHGTTAKDESKLGYHFEGVIPNLQRRWQSTDSEYVKTKLHQYLSEAPCEKCFGSRLRPEALSVTVDAGGSWTKRGGLNLAQITRLTIEQAADFFEQIKLTPEQRQIAAPILKEVQARIGFMRSVGLDYLSLDRATGTLSGGEGQRIRLATQVGSGLVGCCYVLDEPTIGLHQRDNDRLIATLRHLTDIGNSVLVVEHDEDTIRAADWVVDIGPGPGRHGGRVVAQGTFQQLIADPASITGKYLSGELSIPMPAHRRPIERTRQLTVKGAKENNLKSVDVAFPLGGIVCVTGVSGSGKSTLVNQILVRATRRHLHGSKEKPGAHDKIDGLKLIDRMIEVDQSPIGRTPRSNPATYTGVFDLVRDLFTKTKEAKIRGYKPGRFSFNVKGGRCEACEGQGTKKIEMHFLPDVFVVCEQCKGTRYNRETLEITYRGKNISDVLNMTIEESVGFFENFPEMSRLLSALADVGLGYVTLGQSSTTLSGGEAQRVKLATELGKRPTGHTLYVLDEPTTGLHFADIDKLLGVLGRLADQGNTVIVIEHNLDVIKCADWVIDLGPEGGEKGGTIVATGTPEAIAAVGGSYTGQHLKKHLGAPVRASA